MSQSSNRPEPFQTELIGSDDPWDERAAAVLLCLVVVFACALCVGVLATIVVLITEAIG